MSTRPAWRHTLVILLSACAAELPRAENGAPIAPFAVRAVDWNVTHVPLSAVPGVADDGGIVVVLTEEGAKIFSSGAEIATDTKETRWIGAGVLPGPDGSPRWIVAVSADGEVSYLRNLTTFEDVSPRFGFEGFPVLGVASLGGRSAAFQLHDELAIADGRRVTRYKTAPFAQVTGGAGIVVGVTNDGLQVFRVSERSGATYALPHVTTAAVGPDGRIYAATANALYATDATGSLALVYRDAAARIHGLVTSGPRVWFADGGELGVLEGDRVSLTHGAGVGSDARLLASASGDVWAVTGATLARYQAALASPTEQTRWATTVAPVFARSCASCHLPNGRAGLDLSTPAAWEAHRGAIVQRVVVSKTMPPPESPLLDSDRAAVKTWSDTGGR